MISATFDIKVGIKFLIFKANKTIETDKLENLLDFSPPIPMIFEITLAIFEASLAIFLPIFQVHLLKGRTTLG